jgi:hypothetical protein
LQAFNAIENLKNGDRLKADEVSMLIANGKFSRANIDANNALNGNMTTKEGDILAASSFIPSVKAPPKSRSPHLLLNVLIALFADSTVPWKSNKKSKENSVQCY